MVQECNIYQIVTTKLIKTVKTVKHRGPSTLRRKMNRKDKFEMIQDQFLRVPII